MVWADLHPETGDLLFAHCNESVMFSLWLRSRVQGFSVWRLNSTATGDWAHWPQGPALPGVVGEMGIFVRRAKPA
jgi:hypothetical protein